MLEAKDLRIGNYLKDDNGRYIKIESINQSVINENWDGPINESDKTYKLIPGLGLEDCEPIPLTPEILGNFGLIKQVNFANEASYSIDGHGGVVDGLIINEVNGGYEVFASEWTIGETFFFVHQLQNICYFLFNYELEINL